MRLASLGRKKSEIAKESMRNSWKTKRKSISGEANPNYKNKSKK